MRRTTGLWIALVPLCAASALTAPLQLGGRYSVVYDRAGGAGDFEVYNAELDGSNEVNLTNLAGNQFWPTCSPTGKQFAFYFNGPQSDIYVMNRDGTGLFNVTKTLAFGENERDPDWSPNGKFIAYSSNIAGGGIDVISPDGTGYARVFSNTASLSASNPAVSSDGLFIAFTGSTPAAGSAIYKIRIDGAGLAQVTFPAPGFFDLHPDWSPTGKGIVFGRTTGAIFDIWLAKSDGGGEFQLTSTPEFEAFPAWSPDGKLIVYSRRPSYSDPWEVFTMRPNGTAQANLGVLGEHPDFCVNKLK